MRTAIPGIRGESTPFLDGGSSLYQAKRPRLLPVILFLVAATLFLTACGAEVANQNWPGITANGTQVYVSYGPGVAAVDVAEQQMLWSFPEELNPALLFFAPPSVGDERLILGDFGASGGFFSPEATVTIYALDHTGNPGSSVSTLWSRDDVAHDRIVAAPTQTDEQIFIGTADNFVYALDAERGDVQWQFETGHSVWAQPLYTEDFLYVASLDNSVYALDPQSGDVLWQVELGGSIASQPALADGRLYVPSFDRSLHALDAQTGDEVWVADAANWVWGSPTVGNGIVYYGDIEGNVYAVSAETGEQQWTTQAEGAVQSQPLYVDGTLFVVAGRVNEEESRQGELLALNAESGAQLWRRETDVPLFTSPVSANGSIVTVVQEEDAPILQVYDQEDGALVWEFTLPME